MCSLGNVGKSLCPCTSPFSSVNGNSDQGRDEAWRGPAGPQIQAAEAAGPPRNKAVICSLSNKRRLNKPLCTQIRALWGPAGAPGAVHPSVLPPESSALAGSREAAACSQSRVTGPRGIPGPSLRDGKHWPSGPITNVNNILKSSLFFHFLNEGALPLVFFYQ